MGDLLKYGLLLYEIITMLFIKKESSSNMYFFIIFLLIIPLLLILGVKNKIIKNYLLIFTLIIVVFSSIILRYVPIFIVLLLSIEFFSEFNLTHYLLSLILLILSLIIGVKLRFVSLTSIIQDTNVTGGLLKLIPTLIIGRYISFQNKELKSTKNTLKDEINLRYQLKDEGEDLRKSINDIKYLYTIKERNRISRDIHDSVGHVLSAIIIQLGAMSKILENSNKEVSQMANDLRDFTKNGLSDVRKIVHKLKPMDFEKVKFTDSIENMVEDFRKFSKIDVYLNINKEAFKLTELGENAVLRSIQEFLGNSAKYSKCTEINIRLHYNADDLIVTMKDDGIGCSNVTPGNGILGTKERITTLGGYFEYKTSVNNGFYSRIILHKGA